MCVLARQTCISYKRPQRYYPVMPVRYELVTWGTQEIPFHVYMPNTEARDASLACFWMPFHGVWKPRRVFRCFFLPCPPALVVSLVRGFMPARPP